jgi:hypothetical protein
MWRLLANVLLEIERSRGIHIKLERTHRKRQKNVLPKLATVQNR